MKTTRIITTTLLVGAASLSQAAVSPFGINFTSNTGNPTSGVFDGVNATDWTALAVGNSANRKTISAGGTAFSTTTGLTGWYATQDYWNPGTSSGSVNNVFGSTAGGNLTAGLSGYSTVVQFSNVASWLAANNASSLSVTVYYASYPTLSDNTTNAASVMTASYANLFSGVVDAGNASTFTGTAQLIGSSTGTPTGSSALYMTGTTITGVAGDFVVAEVLNSGSFKGGIAGIAISAVPEPGTYGLLGAGALASVAFVRRRRRAA